jgi:hydrogenase/urease accessory protein HupE
MAAIICTIPLDEVARPEPAVPTPAGSGISFLMFSRCILGAVFLVFGALSSQAHDPGLSSAKLTVQANTLRATLTFAPADLEAIFGGAKPDAAHLEILAAQSLEIRFDSQQAQPREASVRTLDNKDVEFQLVYQALPSVRLTVRSLLLDRLPFGHRQYFALAGDKGAILAEKLLSAANHEVEVNLSETAAVAATTSHPFSEFLGMGIKHILTGYDHLLFLFAVLIGARRISSVVKIITAFTVAHSISLALATLGWVEIPSRIIEPAIAASIVYVGIENIARRGEISHRALLTFGFGLVHGFGFASALRDMGVGSNGGAVAVPLLAFNCGVEIGQIMVAACLLPVLWRLKDKPQFNLRWAPTCSVMVALAGGFWFIQRVWMS